MAGTETARTDGFETALAAGLSALESDGVDLQAPVTDAPVDTANSGDAPVQAATPTPETPAAPSGEDAATLPETPVDPSAPVEAEKPNPLEGGEPFTYTANGETRTMPHVHRFPGEGILIEEAAVPQFQLMASRSESLEKANRDLYDQTQRYERLTQWTVQENGQPRVLTGPAALEAARVDHVQTKVALDTLTNALRDPAVLVSLLQQDSQGNLSLNQSAMDNLIVRSELNEMRAAQQIRQQFAGLSSQPITPPAPDITASAPVIVANKAAQHNATALTTEDKSFLQSVLPRFIRPAEQSDVSQNPALRLGEPVIDTAFDQQIQHLQALRASTTTVAKTATNAATFNAAQKAGLKQPTSPPKPATTSTQTSDSPSRTKAAKWDDVFSQAMAELG